MLRGCDDSLTRGRRDSGAQHSVCVMCWWDQGKSEVWGLTRLEIWCIKTHRWSCPNPQTERYSDGIENPPDVRDPCSRRKPNLTLLFWICGLTSARLRGCSPGIPPEGFPSQSFLTLLAGANAAWWIPTWIPTPTAAPNLVQTVVNVRLMNEQMNETRRLPSRVFVFLFFFSRKRKLQTRRDLGLKCA